MFFIRCDICEEEETFSSLHALEKENHEFLFANRTIAAVEKILPFKLATICAKCRPTVIDIFSTSMDNAQIDGHNVIAE